MSLVLISLLVLIVLSLTVIIRFEDKTSGGDRSDILAQQNAVLAMRLALGELQNAMGPDQRVSAPANQFADSDSSRLHAIGVWSSADVDIGGQSFSQGELVSWLASDAKDTSGTLRAGYNTEPVSTDPDNTVILVGPGSLDADGDGQAEVATEQISVDASYTTLTDGSDTVGRYAWWIGDENLKARINTTSPTIENPDSKEAKELSIHFANASPLSVPLALDGLDTSAFENFYRNDPTAISALEHVNFAADSNTNDGTEKIGNQYFHHLNTHAMGVLSDVKNGGLKKDLSLAFEMSEADFNLSEFAGAGPNAYSPWAGATFDVQPIFWLENTSPDGVSVPAHGPTWHILRDYYQLYHEVENVMTAPEMDVRIFGPNLHHPNPLYDYPDALSDDASLHPAYMMTGGRALNFNGTSQINCRDVPGIPSDVVSGIRTMSNGTSFLETEGDPLRSRGFDIPSMVAGTYGPLNIRIITEIGIHFDATGTHTVATVDYNKYRVREQTRDTFVYHNPYNIQLNHDYFSTETRRGFNLRAFMYETGTGTPINNTSESSWESGSDDLRTRAMVAPGSFNAGEIKAYEGVPNRTSQVSSEISGASANWKGSNLNSTTGNLNFGQEFYTNATSVTLSTSFGGYGNSNLTRVLANMTDGSDDKGYRYASNFASYQTFFQAEGTSTIQSNISDSRWPVASSFAANIMSPGIGYEHTPINEQLAASYRFDPSIFETKSVPEYEWTLDQDIDILANSDINNPLPIAAYDLQLKPSGYITADGHEMRYPTYLMTNPLAPVKDNRNLYQFE